MNEILKDQITISLAEYNGIYNELKKLRDTIAFCYLCNKPQAVLSGSPVAEPTAFVHIRCLTPPSSLKDDTGRNCINCGSPVADGGCIACQDY